MINIAFGSFSELKAGKAERGQAGLPQLELKRCTSFEEMLMENHRTILIDSIRDYFEKTQHEFLSTFKSSQMF
jgi:hypothetical protein